MMIKIVKKLNNNNNNNKNCLVMQIQLVLIS